MEKALTGVSLKTKTSVFEIINKILFYVFLANVVFMPADVFNVKIISLIVLLLINIPAVLNIRTHDENIVVFFGLVLTSVTIIWSAILTRNLAENIVLGYPGFILLLYPTIKKYKFSFERAFMFCLRLLAYFIAINALLDILKILPLEDNPAIMWFADTSNAMVGKGDHLPIKIMVFMKTSPLMFVGLAYALRKRQWLHAAVTVFALILSGTRADMITTVGILVLYSVFIQRNKRMRLVCFFGLFVAGLILVADGRVINFLVDMFTRKASSDAVRTGHLQSIFDLWAKKPLTLFTGSGYSSSFYTLGREEFLSNIELSYWNLLRQVGLPLFILMMAMYLYPVFKLVKHKKSLHMVLAYVGYLIVAYTNPFLYSSTGMILVLYMYYICYMNGCFDRKKKPYTEVNA